MTKVMQLRPGLWKVSLPFQGEEGIVGSYLLEGNGELALIDPGPGSTLEALLDAIRMAGLDPQDLTHIFPTHVHLDHAGATGALVRRFPGAQVYVHSNGAPHLLDTTKLVASALRIYGDDMERLWGQIEPTPSQNLHTLEGGDVLNVAGRRLEIHYAPGHAIHHVVFFDPEAGELFAGDVAGVRLEDIDYVRPPTPPPDLDLEAWYSSIDMIKDLRPDVLYIGHFGAVREIESHFASLRERLLAWGEFVLKAMKESKGEVEITTELRETMLPGLERVIHNDHDLLRFEIAANYPMTVQGYMRYWKLKSQNR